MSTTVYLRAKPPTKKKKSSSPGDDLGQLLYRYRVQLLPFCGAGWVGGLAYLLPGWALCLLWAGCTALCLLYGYKVHLDRPVERRYAAAACACCAVWSLYSTWGGGVPSPRAWAVLLLSTCIVSAPWWHHRRARNSIPVRFDMPVSRYDRAQMLTEARSLINEWTAFTSAGRLQGARLQAITYNQWSVVLAIVMRRGATVEEFTARRLRQLESAFGNVRPGSARVERVDTHARLATIRFMTADPHEVPIKPPETGQTDIEKIVIGLFETGEDIVFTLVNTLIAGMTGAGKSGVVNVIIRALARLPQVAIVGIDLKPGAPELSKWRSVMHALADDPASTAEVLDTLLAGFEYRGRIMAKEGKRVWKATKKDPFIVLIVDEVQRVKAAGLGKKLDRVVEIIRAYGGAAIVATQYPVKENLSKTVKENCPQKIGLRTEDASADRVIFGERATRDNWSPSNIPLGRAGSLFIRSPQYSRPLLGRGFWMSDDEIDQDAEIWGKVMTPVDGPTWNQIQVARGEAIASVEAIGIQTSTNTEVAVPEDDGGIVDAVIIDGDPAEEVYRLVCMGISRAIDIGNQLGMSRATTYRHLKDLAGDGRIENNRGRWTKAR